MYVTVYYKINHYTVIFPACSTETPFHKITYVHLVEDKIEKFQVQRPKKFEANFTPKKWRIRRQNCLDRGFEIWI